MARGRKSWNEKVRSVTLFPQQSKQGVNKAVPPCNLETTRRQKFGRYHNYSEIGYSHPQE